MSLTTHQQLEKIVEPRTIQILRTRAIGHNQCHHLFSPLLRPTYPYITPWDTSSQKSAFNGKPKRPSAIEKARKADRPPRKCLGLPHADVHVFHLESAVCGRTPPATPIPPSLEFTLLPFRLLFLGFIALDRLKDKTRGPDGRTEPGWQDC